MRVDGASRGNPGKAGCGAAILEPGSETPHEMSEHLGCTTNNVAEYRGLLLGLKWLVAAGVSRAKIFSDSELLVKQIRGEYRARKPHLLPLFRSVQSLPERLKSLEVIHIPREENRLADRLANRAIDEYAGEDQTVAGLPSRRREESPDSTGQDGR